MKPLDPDTIETQLRAAIDAGDRAEIDRLGAMLDQVCPAPPMPGLLASALYYASVGLHVFPLTPGAKVPLPGSHGCKDATTDEAQVRAWWARTPAANVGIATGHLVDVIDIDGYEGNVSWARSMYDDASHYIGPPILGKVSTPRNGGRHLYVAAGSFGGNRAGMFPGVDVRGLGGYVVSPPSVGADGTPYTWTTGLILDATGVAA